MSRSRLSLRLVVFTGLTAFVLGVGPSSASALIGQLSNGKIVGYQPVSGATVAASAFPGRPLEYHGGPIMPSNVNHALYWDPAGAPKYPANYEPGLNRFFEDLAHDSGGVRNTDSVLTQYTDSTGASAEYVSEWAGALIDTDRYPPSGCTGATICLTTQQIVEEVTHYVDAKGLPQNISNEYFVLTPPGVGGCFEAASLRCQAGVGPLESWVYCAYHTYATGSRGPIIISNDPYVAGTICDRDRHPNGTPSDVTLAHALVHEHSESVTDPELNAWYDSGGEEIGDKCNTHDEAEFGPPLGFTKNGPYNEVVNGHFYYYQREFSNIGEECLQRFGSGLVKATCATNAGTIKFSPGLTNSSAVQAVKIKGTLTGCTGEPFTQVKYSATLKTTGPVSCAVLKERGETAAGNSNYKWTPTAKASTGRLEMLLTETPEFEFAGEVTTGSYMPLTLSGKATENYSGGPTCGEPVGNKAAKPVKSGTFSGSAVDTEIPQN